MNSPKAKAIAYEDKDKVISALKDAYKMNPDMKSIRFLIQLFNEVHGAELLTERSYKTCLDCKLALSNFFKYVIEVWNTK